MLQLALEGEIVCNLHRSQELEWVSQRMGEDNAQIK